MPTYMVYICVSFAEIHPVSNEISRHVK